MPKTISLTVHTVLALSLSLLGAAALAQEGPQMGLPRTALTAGIYQIDTQLALTPEQREIGLMFRRDMPQQEGMLFVFEQPGTQCFWMKNTILPLTAAFVDDHGGYRQPGRHEAANHGFALLRQTGALRTGNECWLVCQERHQSRQQTRRQAIRDGQIKKARPRRAFLWALELKRSSFPRIPSSPVFPGRFQQT